VTWEFLFRAQRSDAVASVLISILESCASLLSCEYFFTPFVPIIEQRRSTSWSVLSVVRSWNFDSRQAEIDRGNEGNSCSVWSEFVCNQADERLIIANRTPSCSDSLETERVLSLREQTESWRLRDTLGIGRLKQINRLNVSSARSWWTLLDAFSRVHYWTDILH